jgi:hypothetical protein
MLGQATHGTNARYTHSVDHVLIAAAERVAGQIADSMGIGTAKSEENQSSPDSSEGLSGLS